MNTFWSRLQTTFWLVVFSCSVLFAQDWTQWGGSSLRNNTPEGKNVPSNPRGRVQHELSVELETNARAMANPNSAVVWHYDKLDSNGDGEIDFAEEFHRSLGSVAIKNDLLFASDFSGLVHCLNAKTGQVHWTCDLLAACWGSPLIVEDKVYIGDEDGDVAIFQLSADIARSLKKTTARERVSSKSWVYEENQEINMPSSIYSTPMVANDVMYIATRRRLFAIAHPESN